MLWILSWWFWLSLIVIIFFIIWLFKKDQIQTSISPNNVEIPIESKNIKERKFSSKGEKISCETAEKIFKVPFNKVRPYFLKNPETGKNLELDCYNPDIKVAIEYNGEQHYKWPNFTNQSQFEFENQVRRDEYKRQTCDENNVYLITIPYYVKNIPEYIEEQSKPILEFLNN